MKGVLSNERKKRNRKKDKADCYQEAECSEMGRYQKIFAEARKNKKNTRACKALEKRQKQNIVGNDLLK